VISRWDTVDLLNLTLAPGPPSTSLRVVAFNVVLWVRIMPGQQLTSDPSSVQSPAQNMALLTTISSCSVLLLLL